MEPYNPNRPTVSWREAPKDKSELLDRLQEAGVPFTAALKYFYDNPEGPASETLNIATDETVPFKYQIRSGNATPASLAEEALLVAAPGPKKRGKLPVDEAATKRINDWLKSEYNKEPANTPRLFEIYRMMEDNKGEPFQYVERNALNWLDPDEGSADTRALLNEIEANFPNEYKDLIFQQPARYEPNGTQTSHALGIKKLSNDATIDNHFSPRISNISGNIYVGDNPNGQMGAIQYRLGDYLKLQEDFSKYQPYADKAKQILSNPNLDYMQKKSLLKLLDKDMLNEFEIDRLP